MAAHVSTGQHAWKKTLQVQEAEGYSPQTTPPAEMVKPCSADTVGSMGPELLALTHCMFREQQLPHCLKESDSVLRPHTVHTISVRSDKTVTWVNQ